MKSICYKLICIGLVFILSACVTAPSKKESASKQEVQKQLLSTREYLPVREYDKEGAIIPFVLMLSPYDGMKGKIKKESVVDFIAARKAYKRKKIDEAEAVLLRLVENDNTLSGPWVLRGDIAFDQSNFEAAIEYYQQALLINKSNPNAYIRLAKTLRIKGDFLLAQNVYAKALASWKHFPEAHLNLAVLYDLYLNDTLQAQQHMEAYQFLTGGKDKKVSAWLEEIQARTGIEPNLYVRSSNASQIQQPKGENVE